MDARESKFNRQIAEAAAEWFVDFSAGDVVPHRLAEFNRWLRTSPQHVHAYLRVAAFWEEADLLKLAPEELERLTQQIVAGAEIVPLRTAARTVATAADESIRAPTAAAPVAESSAHPRRMTRRFAIAACVAMCGVLAGTVFWLRDTPGVTYATETGEQRTLTLADGSVVQLNSQSRLRVAFDEAVRSVELLEGQALFEVAKNPARPFVVVSGSTSVRAVGTQFDVYRKTGATVVTVLEGRVAVSSGATGGSAAAVPADVAKAGAVAHTVDSALLLSAGEQVVVTPKAVLAPRRANVEVATAWTQKRLVFEAAPLSEVAAEFNRYSRRQLIIEDAQLSDVRITGEFASTSLDHMVEFLQQRFAVNVDAQSDQIRISRRP